VLPDLGLRRFVPPTKMLEPTMRVGPLMWHPIVPYPDDPHDRWTPSECDEDGDAAVRFAAVGPDGRSTGYIPV
jgi:hypothetical protein